MKKIRWIIQNNLISENDLGQLQDACKKLNIEFFETIVIPFTDTLPEFPIDDEYENIYYGATTFMNNIYEQLNRPIGLFYNLETFSMENYIGQWGEHMLNDAAEILTVGEFINAENESHPLTMFIRPDGQTGNENDLRAMISRMMDYESSMTMDTKIVFGPAYNIKREWRNYIVNGKVVTSSRYRSNFTLSKSGTDIPEDMIKFVEDRCKEYQPHEVFAMDIAEIRHNDGDMAYYIIECGCMNSVGFYHADIFKYVEGVSNYVTSKL